MPGNSFLREGVGLVNIMSCVDHYHVPFQRRSPFDFCFEPPPAHFPSPSFVNVWSVYSGDSVPVSVMTMGQN